MRIAITCNGPGETAGWLRPLLRRVYELAPRSEIYVFYVPDDYATGREPQLVRSIFPQAHVFEPKAYLKTALGARLDGLPDGVETVLYLGGDLMHASRLHKRFGGALATYKFTRAGALARATAAAYAVDGANAREFAERGVAPERIATVGNLAIDGALIEADLPLEPGAPEGGVLFMPGSRGYEVRHVTPFFFTAALRMRRESPSLPIAFGLSPFTDLDAVRDAIEAGADPRMYAQRGRLSGGDEPALVSLDGTQRFPIVRNALAAAKTAKLAVTIPGTKVIELATVGTPVLACTPLNAPELVAINGPLTYLDRLPLIGRPLKRAVVTGVSRRHRYHTQPNIDAGRALVAELHGALTPGRVARVALERLDDPAWLAASSQALSSLYSEHVGAAARMAGRLLES